MDAVLLRPLAYDRPESLVLAQTIQRDARQTWGTAPPDFTILRQRNRSLDGLAAFYGRPVNVTGDAAPERVRAMIVSGNFFDVLGRQPALGLLATVVLAACSWPAHRALSVRPTTVLRSE